MFQNILKWTFKTVVNGVEKDLYLHLDNDTSLEAVEQAAMQIIAHCAKVKEMQAAQKAATPEPKVDIEPEMVSEAKAAE